MCFKFTAVTRDRLHRTSSAFLEAQLFIDYLLSTIRSVINLDSISFLYLSIFTLLVPFGCLESFHLRVNHFDLHLFVDFV
jgi:hypothetical protein